MFKPERSKEDLKFMQVCQIVLYYNYPGQLLQLKSVLLMSLKCAKKENDNILSETVPFM